MKLKTLLINLYILISIFSSPLIAQQTSSEATFTEEGMPFILASGLFNQDNQLTLDLEYTPDVETFSVYSPTDTSSDKFSNGVVMTAFKNALYCMWQSSAKDEDGDDTWVAYSCSTDDGKTWCEPMILAPTLENGYCTSGGWIANNDTLFAFINIWPKGISPIEGYACYTYSIDGKNWSELATVKMADGSDMQGVIEQDPHIVKGGRIISSAHFHPGLKVCPIYTDNPNGVNGWKKGAFVYTENGDQSRELEPSLFQKSDGTIVMIFRDQKSSFRKIAATSTDNGETWSNAILTDIPDARTKQSAGNLPDGTAYMVGNPVNNKLRIPLVLMLSKDGNCFDKAFLLREGGATMPDVCYPGKAKRQGYHYPKSMVAGGYLYVAYSLNKEIVQFTRIPLSKLSSVENK